jgi:PAS domain S-box-containing protein
MEELPVDVGIAQGLPEQNNSTPHFPGYERLSKLSEGIETLLYKGIRRQDQQPVIIKLLKPACANPINLGRYANENRLTRDLQTPYIVRMYDIEPFEGSFFLVLEDFEGIPLKQWMSAGQPAGATSLPAAKFFDLALRIVDGLAAVHTAGIIHRDLRPENILLNPASGEAKITGFELATTMGNEGLALVIPRKERLAYLSPEQTGRINRTVDYRTDFYTLGVTFYELLTGHLPFEAVDAVGLIHAHLAKSPAALHVLNPQTPEMLSLLVLKLMAKAPEDRYQSAIGLREDLHTCAQLWQAHGMIPIFDLGRKDRAEYFLIPKKLYGRLTETSMIMSAFERTAQGQAEMVLISGMPGVGKTALVYEIREPVIRQNAFFAKGSFDPFKQGIPFSAFVEALRDLMRQWIAGNAASIAQWKPRILEALGNSGQILKEVIPELELIIGQQPSLPELSPNAAQNRFYILLLKFLDCVTSAEHPLVLFLDDLQWADVSSLELIQQLISPGGLQHLLLIGAYRDTEISSIHPLRKILMENSTQAGTITNISLAPLKMSDINQLIADALSCSVSMAISLASRVYRITRGNPLFSNEFLKSLHDEGLITFNHETGFWQCDVSKVHELPLTDDVMEFLAIRLQKLPPDTQEVLKRAACIGRSFDLTTLAIISPLTHAETSNALWNALQAAIVFSQNDDGEKYEFLHDRVWQAAYSLIPNDQQQQMHWHIGQRLFENASDSERKEKIWEIVNQFNRGITLACDPIERWNLAELNLDAGQKAKASIAYRAAREYFTFARQLSPTDSWRSHYAFTLNLYEFSIEAAYLNGDFKEVEELSQIAFKEISSPLDRIKIFEVRSEAFMAQGRFSESIDAAFEIFQLLGEIYPREPNQADIAEALQEIQSAYSDKNIEELIDLPLMTDRYKLAVLRVSNSISSAAHIFAPNLFTYLALKGVALSIQYGNTSASAYFYTAYGQILTRATERIVDIESGYKFGKLALELVQKLDSRELQSKIQSIFYAFIAAWKCHFREMLAFFQSAYNSALEVGDFQYAAYSAYDYCAFAYFSGINKEISELQRETEFWGESVRQMRLVMPSSYFKMLLQALHDLREGRASLKNLKGELYDEESMLSYHLQANDQVGLIELSFHKLILNCLFGEYRQAVEDADRAKQLLQGIRNFPFYPILYFYDSLARLAAHRENPQSSSRDLMILIETNQAKMKIWAQHAPMNCLHKYHLIEAERYRAVHDKASAIDHYDQAITEAKASGYLREEALANELAGSFFLDWGKEKLALPHIEEAYHCYMRWGANGKAAQLEQRYGQSLAAVRSARRHSAAGHIPEVTEGIVDKPLDLDAVVKASQAIAREIELAPLLMQLMRIVLENAGAQRGALLLEHNGVWVIEAEGDVDRPDIPILQTPNLHTSGVVSAEIVLRVAHTCTSIVLDDATVSGDFIHDPYIVQHGVKSVICAPLVNQGKLSGIVYLENNLITHAFSADRLELLNLLTAQMALSLDNARLYQKAQEEIAERKAAEAALRENELRFRTIFDSVNDSIIVHDSLTGRILDANDTATTMYGYSREELLQMSISELSSQKLSSQESEALAFVGKLTKEGPQLFEWNAKNKEGRAFWVEVNTRLAMINGVQRTLVTIRDIRKRKQIEAALQRNESVLKATMESISDGLLIVSQGGKILYDNSRFFDIWSIPVELQSATEERELLNHVLKQLVNPEQFFDRVQEIYGLGARTEDMLHFVNGRMIERFCYPLEWPGEESARVWLFRDVTERMHAMEEIRRMNEELEKRVNARTTALEQANKELEAFSYSVSHDLRAPLRAIAGYSRMLVEDYATKLDAEGLRFCSVVQNQTHRMSQLIDDLLSFSRLTRAGMSLAWVDMEALAQSVVQELTTAEERSRIEFRLEALPPAIGDSTLLHQVWSNVLSNAIKFSRDKERAIIEASYQQKEHETIYYVHDNGAGFDMAYSDKLFGVFQRLHSEREFEGTGVGLAIVQRVIHRHGGRVWAEAQVGKGATFYFSLPRKGDVS